MIIKIVTSFAGLDQKMLCSVQDIELVKKSLPGIAKKLFLDSMDDQVLRFANKDGTKVDYSKPRLDPNQKWSKQNVQTGSIIYVLPKSQELSDEEIAKLPKEEPEEGEEPAAAAAAEEKQAAPAAASSSGSKSVDADDAAPAAQSSAPEGVNKSPRKAEEAAPATPPPPPAPPRSGTPNNRPAPAAPPAAPTAPTAYKPVPQNVAPQQYQQQQQQQQPQYAAAAAPHNYYGPSGTPPPPTPPSALFLSPSAPQQMGPITVINTANPGVAASAPDAKSAESMIYYLREQNRMLADQVAALDIRNRELEAKAANAAYSHESSPAVVAQMQLKLRDAAAEIERLRSNEAFLRAQLDKVTGAQGTAVSSVLEKLDPQTRALMTEDKAELDSMIEARRRTLASTLSLYQLAHDDTEQAKIRAQQERQRRESLLTTSAFSGGGGGGRPVMSITAGGGSSVDVAQQLLLGSRR